MGGIKNPLKPSTKKFYTKPAMAAGSRTTGIPRIKTGVPPQYPKKIRGPR